MKKNTNHLPSESSDLVQIKRRIVRNHHPVSMGTLRPACVFLLLYEKENEFHIPAILKADNEGYPWANQVALPGGRVDEGDHTPEDTAFRELEEELGITRPHVNLIGSMGHFQTLNSTEIQVFTGVWDQEEAIRFDPSEIARVIHIPLNHLLETHQSNRFSGRIPGWDELLYPVDDVVVWGATAKILHYFLELAYHQ